MKEITTEPLAFSTESPSPNPTADPLTAILRQGARHLLAWAVEADVAT